MRHLPPSRHCRTSAMVWEDRCDLHVGSCSIKPKQKVSGFSTGLCFTNFFRLSHSWIIDVRNSATQLPAGLLARRVRSRGPHRLYAPSVSRLSDSNWHRPHALSVPPYSDSNCGVGRNGARVLLVSIIMMGCRFVTLFAVCSVPQQNVKETGQYGSVNTFRRVSWERHLCARAG